VQDFHDSGGGFGADTSEAAVALAKSLGWNSGRFRQFADRLAQLTRMYEGEAGFFPPP
jgi:hypothetical protein